MNISNEEKKAMAQDTLKMLELSMYRQVLVIGEDPDTFDYSTLGENMDPIDEDKYKSIIDLSVKINNIKAIIESLS